MKSVVAVLSLVIALYAVPAFAADAVLSWNANTEADLAGYQVFFAPQSCTALGPLAPLVVAGVNVQVMKPLVTYTHVGLPVIDGTVCWELTAVDTAGNVSGRSNRVSKVVNLVPPLPPTGLDAVVR